MPYCYTIHFKGVCNQYNIDKTKLFLLMLQTFKDQLKAKSTAAGVPTLSNARLEAEASKLNAKFPDLTEPADHDAKIDDLYDADRFKEIQAFDDFQRAKEKREAEKKKEPEKKAEPEKKEDEVPAWAQALIDQNKALNDKINGIEKEKTVGSIKQKIAEKLKDVPGSIWSKRALPESEDAIDAFITEVETDYKTDFLDKGLITQPAGGSKYNPNGKATKEDIKSIVDGIMPRN